MNVPKPRILFGPTMDKEEDLTINIRHSNQDELDDSKEDDTFELPPVLRTHPFWVVLGCGTLGYFFGGLIDIRWSENGFRMIFRQF